MVGLTDGLHFIHYRVFTVDEKNGRMESKAPLTRPTAAACTHTQQHPPTARHLPNPEQARAAAEQGGQRGRVVRRVPRLFGALPREGGCGDVVKGGRLLCLVVVVVVVVGSSSHSLRVFGRLLSLNRPNRPAYTPQTCTHMHTHPKKSKQTGPRQAHRLAGAAKPPLHRPGRPAAARGARRRWVCFSG